MPRNSRVVAVGYPHHFTQRGNNREPVFFDDDDRFVYLDLLSHYTQTAWGTLPEVSLSCPSLCKHRVGVAVCLLFRYNAI